MLSRSTISSLNLRKWTTHPPPTPCLHCLLFEPWSRGIRYALFTSSIYSHSIVYCTNKNVSNLNHYYYPTVLYFDVIRSSAYPPVVTSQAIYPQQQTKSSKAFKPPCMIHLNLVLQSPLRDHHRSLFASEPCDRWVQRGA